MDIWIVSLRLKVTSS